MMMQWAEKHGIEIWEELLTTHPSRWLGVLHKWDIDPENDDNPDTDDDPVPKAVWEILPRIDTGDIFDCLKQLPVHQSKHFNRRVREARKSIFKELRELWEIVVRGLRLKLPLLILDEAHHLKNAQTRLASLFHVPEAHDDADEISRGALGGVFDRMLFLTATPV